MREDVLAFIRECEIYQTHNVEKLAPTRLLQPLPIPNQVWEPLQGKTTIFVVVDRLSKYAHFIPISHPYTAVSVAHVFFDNIFKLHGMPCTIVCDKDFAFTSDFWKGMFRLNGISFNFSSAYHPQTDGQT